MFPRSLILSPMPCLVFRTMQRTSRTSYHRHSFLVEPCWRFIATSLAPSTCTMNSQSVTLLHEFVVTFCPGKPWFRELVRLICTFITHSLGKGLSPASVTSCVSAIAFYTNCFSFPSRRVFFSQARPLRDTHIIVPF